jgi:hypothetical protein
MKRYILLLLLIIPLGLFGQIEDKTAPFERATLITANLEEIPFVLNPHILPLEYDYTVFQKWQKEALPLRVGSSIFTPIDHEEPIILTLHDLRVPPKDL